MTDETNIPAKLLKPYDPTETESRIYKLWEESGFFNPDNLPGERSESFTIMMPPPNVTGMLTMGHALTLGVEDLMIRFARMNNKRTLYLPGTDHAAIATQSKVEKEIQKNEGKSRHDLGREEMLKRIGEFATASHNTIVNQVRAMGTSCDWSREAFTLDNPRNLAVNTMFKKMYDDGLIYRGHRIVNWDPKGQTTISDDEIVYEEREATMYTFKYSKDFPISISTTRPETKVGDTAVAVHPLDTRYQQYIGKTYEVSNFCGVPLTIKVVGDEAVEKEFGTGALGVTPAHSMTDWEIADRHDLPRPQVINEYGKMMVGNENILGKKTTDAREAVVVWLKSEGLLEKEEKMTQNISTAERTGGIIEPLPKLQWFVAVNKEFTLPYSEINGISSGSKTTLKEIMQKAVAGGQITIIPEYLNKTYFHWIDNLRDWCISRQIWYGHRIPVWYCLHCKKETTGISPKSKIYLIRHGETDSNKEKRIAGSTDLPLNEVGISQANEVAEQLKNTQIDYIVCSDLLRAKQTAEVIQKVTGAKIIIDNELRERHYGIVEGQLSKDIQPVATYKYEGKPEGGESYQEVEERIHASFLNHKKDFQGKNILIVSHGGALRTLMKRLRDLTPEEMLERKPIKNVELMILDVAEKCHGCNSDLFEQDPDTLDTWFSSALWTFSTLGWPEKTKDLELYHPTQVLETGPDILFFWVARMILMTGYGLGTIPFHTVYIHGIVRDAQGRKMSKSLGNSPDPLLLTTKYGADALRVSLIMGNTSGADQKFSEDKVKAQKHFANKLWNITRFVLGNTGNKLYTESDITEASDIAYFNELQTIIADVTTDLESYRFHLASEKLYHYVWNTLADKIIEESKPILNDDDQTLKNSRSALLFLLLRTSLVALHPFMPFVTEELWSLLPGRKGLLMVESWPKHAES